MDRSLSRNPFKLMLHGDRYRENAPVINVFCRKYMYFVDGLTSECAEIIYTPNITEKCYTVLAEKF